MKTVYRLIPCPSYDITALESWLSDCAREGLLLQKDGFFGPFACFEPARGLSVKYRMMPAQKSKSLWTDGEPDEEQQALSEKYGWEYTARIRDFHVYRCFDPAAREPNTDAAVQALALNAVKKRQRSALFSALFFVLIYPLLVVRGCPLMAAIALGTVWTGLALLLGLLMIREELRSLRYLKALQRSLRLEEEAPRSDWKKGRRSYLTGKLLRNALGLLLLCVVFRTWGFSVSHANAVPLEDYAGTLPFASVQELAGEDSGDYRLTFSGMGNNFNTVEEHSELLAPRIIEFNEHAAVKRADGQSIDGGLYVEYFELRSSALARALMRELLRLTKWREHTVPLRVPAQSADEVYAYEGILHSPALLIRKGNVAARVSFYQTSADTIPTEEWTVRFCENLGRK